MECMHVILSIFSVEKTACGRPLAEVELTVGYKRFLSAPDQKCTGCIKALKAKGMASSDSEYRALLRLSAWAGTASAHAD